MLPFPLFGRIQGGIPKIIPILSYFHQLQNISAASNQWHFSNDAKFMLNTISTTIPALKRPPMAPLKIGDTF